MHRPAPATVISVIALFFAMSGTAVAATGGDFILGKPNTATAVTSLSNTKGTALSLSSSSATPPLKVSNSVQVPKLNASELGGTPASGYMQGGGDTTAARLTLTGATSLVPLLASPGGELSVYCDPGGFGSGAVLLINPDASTAAEATALWWNKDGVNQAISLASGQAYLSPAGGATTPYLVVAQVNNVTSISTITATEAYDSTTDTCSFTAQVVTTNG
jgi:hypothetical protein